MPPYRRKGYKRSYGRSRSTSRRRRPMGGSFMKRAKTRAYANLRTGGLLAIERKFLDLGRPATGITTGGTGIANNTSGPNQFSPSNLLPVVYRSATGTILSPLTADPGLNVIGQDDTGSGRDGRQVINDSIHLRGHCYCDGGSDLSVGPAPVVNIVLVLDTQTNGAVPAGSAIFVNPCDFTATGTASGQAPFVNLSNSKRFRILKHVRRALNPSVGFADAGGFNYVGVWTWSMDIPLQQMKTNYVSDAAYASGSTPTVASIGDNGLFLFAWSNRAANEVVLQYNSRLRFRG